VVALVFGRAIPKHWDDSFKKACEEVEVMLKRGLFSCAVLGIATSAFAGARIELRPLSNDIMTGMPVNVDVFLVDTGNPQGNIRFRGLQLDVTASPSTTSYFNYDEISTNPDDFEYINWDLFGPIALGGEFFPLTSDAPHQTTSWIWPLSTPQPGFMAELPDNGEEFIGRIQITTTQAGGPLGSGGSLLLDVANPAETDDNYGAYATFGFGGEGDPVVLWRAENGTPAADLLTTGWRLPNGQSGSGPLTIVPEPTTLALLAVGGLAATRRRRAA
jgi:hypothetical protein